MVARLPGDGSAFSGKDPALLLYDEVRSRITSRDFATWFAETPCSFKAPDRFVLTAPNRFRKAWMQKNYGELLRSCARFILDHEVHIDFLVQDSKPSFASAERAPPPAQRSEASSLEERPERRTIPVQGTLRSPLGTQSSRGSRPEKPPPERPKLKREFTFENFVVGPSTRVAHAAARAVSDSPAKAYNPLFLYGEPGVGKTHLVQAVCHRILATTRLRVGYVSSSDIQLNDDGPPAGSAGLPVRWQETDVLVIDDLQFLPAKESIQSRLFHTVNSLLETNRQILLASRSHPRDAENIPERLASRFQWGLVAHLQSPSFHTRMDILLRKAHLHGCELPLEVAEFLADRIRDNPRALEGALVQTMTFSSIHGAPLDLTTARLALENLSDGSRPSGLTTIAEILQAVQEYFQIRPKDLLARCKTRSLVYPRQMGMYLARQLTTMSLQEIGMHFGGRDHTTVLYSTDRIARRLKSEASTRADLHALESRVGSCRGS